MFTSFCLQVDHREYDLYIEEEKLFMVKVVGNVVLMVHDWLFTYQFLMAALLLGSTDVPPGELALGYFA